MLCWLLIALVGAYFLFDWLIRLLKVGNFTNKYVLVSGCDSGFGRELAIRLDQLGFPVFAGCLSPAGMESLRKVASSRLVTLALDISSDQSIQKALETVKKALPSENALWAVVNNAGITGPITPTEMCLRKDFEHTCQVNAFGHMELTRVFLPLLRQSRGRVVTITSIMGRCPATAAPYCVSKFALEAYCDILRREMGNFGVKVSIIEPGYFRTTLITNTESMQNNVRSNFNRASPDVQAAYGQATLDTLLELAKGVPNFASTKIDKVVDAYVAAVTCAYPRPRYTVGMDAKFLFVPLTYMPEWIVDWALQSNRMNSVIARSNSA